MSSTDRPAVPPPPAWLVWLTSGSIGAALLALCALLWAKWGLVLAMGEDVLKYCF